MLVVDLRHWCLRLWRLLHHNTCLKIITFDSKKVIILGKMKNFHCAMRSWKPDFSSFKRLFRWSLLIWDIVAYSDGLNCVTMIFQNLNFLKNVLKSAFFLIFCSKCFWKSFLIFCQKNVLTWLFQILGSNFGFNAFKNFLHFYSK